MHAADAYLLFKEGVAEGQPSLPLVSSSVAIPVRLPDRPWTGSTQEQSLVPGVARVGWAFVLAIPGLLFINVPQAGAVATIVHEEIIERLPVAYWDGVNALATDIIGVLPGVGPRLRLARGTFWFPGNGS